jgi:hypothetical protein
VLELSFWKGGGEIAASRRATSCIPANPNIGSAPFMDIEGLEA